MKIESKYEINDHIWILEIVNKEISLFDDYITEITYDGNNISYWCEMASDSVQENEIIKYDDKDGLYEKIIELTKTDEYKME